MLLFGFEIIGFILIYYSIKELSYEKKTSVTVYQPPPRYEIINENRDECFKQTDHPPNYDSS